MRTKDVIKKLLVESREEGIPEDLVERDLSFRPMKKKSNTIVGIRRAGKTYSMYQIMKGLKTDNIFYINFEDERIINPNVEHLTNILPVIKETFDLTKDPIYLFVDEIQNIEKWEKWARRISEKSDVYLFISGSSSKLSSKEIATSLRGRTLTNYVFPLSFKEFLHFKGVEYKLKNIEHSQKRFKIKKMFEEYLKYGGFPEIVLEKEKKQKLILLRDYFSTIVARDIIERYGIKKPQALESFMKLLVNNFSRLISFSKAENWLKSLGVKITKATLIEYFDYMKSSFFLFDNTIFSYSVKDRLQYPRKIYLVDNGFSSALTDRFSTDKGWFFENSVAIELFKKTVSSPSMSVFYWKGNGEEVDFVVKKGVKVQKLIQVCFDMNEEVKEREVKSLINASKKTKCDDLLVITGDYSGKEKIEGKDVIYRPLWKWLLK